MAVKVMVLFSGGKDSQASLIWAAEKYGADRIEAVFCDTNWEHPCTIEHVHKVCEDMGVRLTTLTNPKYPEGFKDLAKALKYFPRPNRRVCTSVLKADRVIDYVLSQDDNVIAIQGIRAAESASRSKMLAECSYFKEYVDADAGLTNGKALYHRKAVREWLKTHDASVLRPIFTWSAQQVIDYILAHGQQPNPLYRKGASRVGCFPCIMSSHRDLRVVANDPEMRQRLIDMEAEVNTVTRYGTSGFFVKGFIPERYCKTWGNNCPTAEEVLNYVTRNDVDLLPFDEDDPGYSCMSLYHGLCE